MTAPASSSSRSEPWRPLRSTTTGPRSGRPTARRPGLKLLHDRRPRRWRRRRTRLQLLGSRPSRPPATRHRPRPRRCHGAGFVADRTRGQPDRAAHPRRRRGRERARRRRASTQGPDRSDGLPTHVPALPSGDAHRRAGVSRWVSGRPLWVREFTARGIRVTRESARVWSYLRSPPPPTNPAHRTGLEETSTPESARTRLQVP